MDSDLFFIASMAQALGDAEPAAALRAAFDSIRAAGSNPGRRHGYRRFRRFMSMVARHTEGQSSGSPDAVIAALAASLLGEIEREFDDSDRRSRPSSDSGRGAFGVAGADEVAGHADSGDPGGGGSRWSHLDRQTRELVRQAMERPAGPQVIVERDSEPVAAISLGSASAPAAVPALRPGAYRIRLDTGRVLWQGDLLEQDLLWAQAFPRRPLRMAADTGRQARQPTRSFVLLEGTIVARVFPGVESGTMELEPVTAEGGRS